MFEPGWKRSMAPWNPGLWDSRSTLYSHLQFLTLAFFAEVKTEYASTAFSSSGRLQSFPQARETDVPKADKQVALANATVTSSLHIHLSEKPTFRPSETVSLNTYAFGSNLTDEL
jgi:hypothetical protein